MANSNKNDTINEAIWSDTGDEVFSLVKDEVVQANRRDKRQLSSGSSTLSNSKGKKKTKLGSLEEKGDDEDEPDADEWSDEEFVITYKDAPVWAKGMMPFLQKSVGAIKVSTRKLNGEVTTLRRKFDKINSANVKRIENLEKSVDFVSEKDENWIEEKAVSLNEITQLRAEVDLRIDDIEQYSRRSCLVVTGVPEKEEENTDDIILNTATQKLGIKLELHEIAKSHRLGTKKESKEGQPIHRPIIVKIVSDRSKQKLFHQKKKLKGTGISIFGNLTQRRAQLMKEVKRIAGVRNVWSNDGNIFTFNHFGKIVKVTRNEDLKKVKPALDTRCNFSSV